MKNFLISVRIHELISKDTVADFGLLPDGTFKRHGEQTLKILLETLFACSES